MASTQLRFSSRAEHRAWIEAQASLPDGFRIGTAQLSFIPAELPRPARMCLTLLALDRPTPAFAARFTRNAFPGAPVILGRRRLSAPALGALVVNNKISNVCAPGGVDAAERVCAAAARLLGFEPEEVLPASTGVIGWRLPAEEMVAALPEAASMLQSRSALSAAEAILTTDLYPKVRRASVGQGSIVGFAKGAGMIEPNLATMLVFLLTDLDVPREVLRPARTQSDGDQMLGGHDPRPRAFHFGFDRLRQGFLVEGVAGGKELDRPAVDDDVFLLGLVSARMEILVDRPHCDQ